MIINSDDISEDELDFSSEDEGNQSGDNSVAPWRLLVVDDDQGIHDVTVLLLSDFQYRGRPLEILHAFSGAEACDVFERHSDIALVLMDVVMETDRAGLEAVRYIREELGNHIVRIVVRTGQPGAARESEVINSFQIDDYRDKTELSAVRLITVVQTALASYSANQSLLERSRNLDISNEVLQQFAFVAAHDLKAPLRSIGTFADLLTTDLAGSLTDETSQYLGYIQSGVRNMSSLLDDLLELSTIGNSDTLLSEVDCNKALDEALENLGDVIRERDALIERSELPTMPQASYRYWVQLLQNLIANGIKFQDGPKPKIIVRSERKEDCWVVSVADCGIGISEANAEQIFKPFQRLHGVAEYEGTGLGLALCQRVADFHNGDIWVESVEGEGTTVFLSVPLNGC